MYQVFGTEEFVLQAGGVLCPQPGCGMGILAPEDCRRITCQNGCGVLKFSPIKAFFFSIAPVEINQLIILFFSSLYFVASACRVIIWENALMLERATPIYLRVVVSIMLTQLTQAR